MSSTTQGTLVLVATLLMLVSGIPVAFGLGAISIIFLLFFHGIDSMHVVAETFWSGLDEFTLVAIPMFVMMGAAIGSSPAGKDLYEALDRWLYRVPGGLVISNLGACAIFAALTGSSPACCAAIGKMGIPEMRRRGYPDDVATGSICAGGTLGILIPPSITFILYGIATETSIGRLFLAGLVPGLMLTFMLAAYVMWFARRHGIGAGEAFKFDQFLRGLTRGIWALGMPFIILGGIYGGVFSPTEAAAVACVYAAFVTRFVFRELGWRDIVEAASATVLFSAQILIIVACAGVFSWLLTVNQIPAAIVGWLQALNISAWMFLLTINVILLVVGCFLDPLSAILLLTPLLVPLVKAFGIDTVHFGIVVTVNLAIGLFHPPFGMNIFVAQSVLGLELRSIYRGIIPFLVIYLIALGLITYIPVISLGGMRFLLGLS